MEPTGLRYPIWNSLSQILGKVDIILTLIETSLKQAPKPIFNNGKLSYLRISSGQNFNAKQ